MAIHTVIPSKSQVWRELAKQSGGLTLAGPSDKLSHLAALSELQLQASGQGIPSLGIGPADLEMANLGDEHRRQLYHNGVAVVRDVVSEDLRKVNDQQRHIRQLTCCIGSSASNQCSCREGKSVHVCAPPNHSWQGVDQKEAKNFVNGQQFPDVALTPAITDLFNKSHAKKVRSESVLFDP